MKLAKKYAELHPERFSADPWIEPFPQDDIIEARKLVEHRGKVPLETMKEFYKPEEAIEALRRKREAQNEEE